MLFNHFTLYVDDPPVSELREIASHLGRILKDYATLETEIRKVALTKGRQIDELLLALYDEHWEPLRWRMRTAICSPSRCRGAWVDAEIQDTLGRELLQIWEGFKAVMDEAEKATKVLEWHRAGRLKDNAERIGNAMSIEQRKKAFIWMMLQERQPEDVTWADAVMAVWKEEMLKEGNRLDDL
ncbi:hypothetical protein QFC20_007565 [Naganishia adeliensis]|uniref:Uncharacterized protein n=1 Tax=Naganishia adeliensis TaxID=92952 RepID=A0ACC2UY09_9TREE|nr:hypothetical protein QFC20_007565 [Naganishia adeliensis]